MRNKVPISPKEKLVWLEEASEFVEKILSAKKTVR